MGTRIKPYKYFHLIINDSDSTVRIERNEQEDGEDLEVLIEHILYLLSQKYVLLRGHDGRS